MIDVFEKFIQVATKDYGINPLYCVSVWSCSYQCGSIYFGNKLQTLQDLFLEIDDFVSGEKYTSRYIICNG